MTDVTLNNIIIAVIAILPTTVSSIAALVTSLRTKDSVRNLHLLVNGRLTELLELTAKSSKAEGILETKSAGKPK